jgi:hypothetical protein
MDIITATAVVKLLNVTMVNWYNFNREFIAKSCYKLLKSEVADSISTVNCELLLQDLLLIRELINEIDESVRDRAEVKISEVLAWVEITPVCDEVEKRSCDFSVEFKGRSLAQNTISSILETVKLYSYCTSYCMIGEEGLVSMAICATPSMDISTGLPKTLWIPDLTESTPSLMSFTFKKASIIPSTLGLSIAPYGSTILNPLSSIGL